MRHGGRSDQKHRDIGTSGTAIAARGPSRYDKHEQRWTMRENSSARAVSPGYPDMREKEQCENVTLGQVGRAKMDGKERRGADTSPPLLEEREE